MLTFENKTYVPSQLTGEMTNTYSPDNPDVLLDCHYECIVGIAPLPSVWHGSSSPIETVCVCHLCTCTYTHAHVQKSHLRKLKLAKIKPNRF